MKELQQIWEEGTCPIFNGIMFADGTVASLKLAEHSPGCRQLCRAEVTSLKELDKQDKLASTALGEHNQIFNVDGGLRAIVGEGGMGADGFVALIDESEGEAKWLAFFDFSNPFDEAEFTNTELLCKNNLGELWSFPLERPQDVKITNAKEQ